jgi:hypothetical protein
MFSRRNGIIALISGIFFLVSANVVAMNENGIHVSCGKYSKQLLYADYGLKTPPVKSDWKCDVIWWKDNASNPLILWQKNKTKISFSKGEIGKGDFSIFEKYVDRNNKLTEPMRSIRLRVEAYLGTKEFIKKDENTALLVKQFQADPKAILFSPNNDRVIFYDHMKNYDQFVHVYRTNDEKHYLTVSCSGCTADEFFSMVVNPLIQK